MDNRTPAANSILDCLIAARMDIQGAMRRADELPDSLAGRLRAIAEALNAGIEDLRHHVEADRSILSADSSRSA